ncbi:MAG: Uma2 family endonuclease [Methylothermaceae bacterium]|nr:Uma2 family endonuclease [Methylothermaceae bacterium]
MGEAGIFSEDDRVELIEGEIFDMTPIGHQHAGLVNRLNRLLVMAAGGRAVVSVQNPLRLSEQSEPQPDLALLKPRADDYQGAAATATDVLLVVEVADTSRDYDRTVKIPLYAQHDIPEAWLIDLPGKVVEVYRDPSPDGYRDVRRYGREKTIRPLHCPEVEIETARRFYSRVRIITLPRYIDFLVSRRTNISRKPKEGICG